MPTSTTTTKKLTAHGHRISVQKEEEEVARAYLWVLSNDLHEEPFGLMEDVFVSDEHQGKGIGSSLVREVIALARREGCYKLIATSRHERPRVHALYKKIGFKDHGTEYRMDF